MHFGSTYSLIREKIAVLMGVLAGKPFREINRKVHAYCVISAYRLACDPC